MFPALRISGIFASVRDLVAFMGSLVFMVKSFVRLGLARGGSTVSKRLIWELGSDLALASSSLGRGEKALEGFFASRVCSMVCSDDAGAESGLCLRVFTLVFL